MRKSYSVNISDYNNLGMMGLHTLTSNTLEGIKIKKKEYLDKCDNSEVVVFSDIKLTTEVILDGTSKTEKFVDEITNPYYTNK